MKRNKSTADTILFLTFEYCIFEKKKNKLRKTGRAR